MRATSAKSQSLTSRKFTGGDHRQQVDRAFSEFAFPVLITSTAAQVIAITNRGGVAEGYESIVAFPTLFLLTFFATFGRHSMRTTRSPILLGAFTLIQWLRFVVMPTAIILAGGRVGVPVATPATSSLRLACLLIVAEFLITSCLMFVLAGKRKSDSKPAHPRKLILRGDRLVYLAFLAFAAAVLVQGGTGLVNVGVLSAGSGERVGDVTDTRLVITRQIVLVALLLAFTWAAAAGAELFRKTGKRKAIYFPLLLGLVNVSVIVGERRSSQVLTAFCVTMVLIATFPTLRRRILVTVWGLAVAILALMTMYKTFMVFQYDSYSTALDNSEFSVSLLAQTLQAYFAGPQILATALEFGQSQDLQTGGLMYDMIRSTVPISFFLKGGQLTSVAFNQHLYGADQATGQVLSSSALGMLYLGPTLFWVIGAINLLLGYWLERLMWNARSLETLLIFSYVFMRVALNLTANTPALISGVTIMLASGGLVVTVARLLGGEPVTNTRSGRKKGLRHASAA